MSDIYVVLIVIACIFIILGFIVLIIEKKIINERELEYSKSINLTEIRNQLIEKDKEEEDFYEPVIIESKTIDEKV